MKPAGADALPVRWTASWVEPVEAADSPPHHRPAHHLAGEFDAPANVVSARLWATAHGVYEAFLNGERIGDIEMTPGFTSYRRNLQVHCFDVTGMLRTGRNALGATLSDGWWRGQHGVIREIDAYGADVAFLAELHMELDDGTTVVAGTDATWRSTRSHILAADLIAGEVHDLRTRVDGWCVPHTDRSAWDAVRVVDHDTDNLCAVIGPPVRRVQELQPVSITTCRPGATVVDFGQNSNG
ncbi:MAG: alpha-L-rhamnosidase N-terminal domain-containing protein, partial [Actinomycetota bacterium]